MYDYLSGKLIKKLPTEAVVDVNGVGYACKISLSTSQQLPQEGEPVTLKTYLHVREDILQLYGFASDQEREIFKALIAVSGVGPKLAQTILSGLSARKLIAAIQMRDESILNSISGVGKKTAQRLIVELTDKLKGAEMPVELAGEEAVVNFNALESEAIMALISLGYHRQKAEKAVLKARTAENKIVTAEELIKKALQAI